MTRAETSLGNLIDIPIVIPIDIPIDIPTDIPMAIPIDIPMAIWKIEVNWLIRFSASIPGGVPRDGYRDIFRGVYRDVYRGGDWDGHRVSLRCLSSRAQFLWFAWDVWAPVFNSYDFLGMYQLACPFIIISMGCPSSRTHFLWFHWDVLARGLISYAPKKY